MAQPRGLTQFAFASGIDESQQTEVLDPSAGFTRLENVRQDKRGAISKRPGYDYLETSRLDATYRTAGRKLFSHRDQLCTVDGTYLDVYGETVGASIVRDMVPETACSQLPIPSANTAGAPYAIGYVNGYLVLGWVHLGSGPAWNAYVGVVDADTGATVLPPTPVLSSSGNIDLAVSTFGTTAMVFVGDAALATVAGRYLDTSSSAGLDAGWVSLGASIGTDFSGGLVADSFADRAVLAYATTSAGTDRCITKTVDTTGVITLASHNTSSVTPGTTGVAIAVSPDQTAVWTAWDQGSTVYARSLDTSLNSAGMASKGDILTVSGTVLNLFLALSSATEGAVVANGNDGAEAARIGKVAGSADATGVESLWASTWVVGKPFYRGGYFYGPFSGPSLDSLTYCEWSPGSGTAPTDVRLYLRPVAQPIVRGLFASLSCRQVATSGSKVWHPYLAASSATVQASGCTVLDFAATTRWQAIEHGGVTYLSGGLLSFFDGQRVREAGFCTVPKQPTTSQTGTGQTTTLGGWAYVATYSDVDSAGNLHISGVSRPSSATGNFANKSIAVTTSPLAISARGIRINDGSETTNLRCDLWRTEDGGSTYYWLATLTTTPSAAVTYTDNTADSILRTRSLLYGTGSLPATNGSSQDHRAPPGLSCITSYNGMLVGAAGSSVWSSSQSIAGEGLWFSPVWETPLDGVGEVTALAAQDGTLFVFGRRCIYAVAGEAPSDNAASGGLGVPRKLAADVGCIDPRSVVVTALGVFFQSERGLEFLSRGQSVEWIGEAVQATLASYPVVTSATLDSAHALARFTCAASETDNAVSDTGVHLVYDLTLRTWVSVDKVTNGNNASRAAQSASMVYLGGAWRFGWLDKDGRVLVEELPSSATLHLDLRGYYWITMRAETSWTKLGGIQGRHMLNRVLLLARKSTRADLSFSAAYDYSETYQTPQVWLANDVDTLSTDIGRLQLEHQLHNDSEGVSLRVLIEDATPTGGTIGTGKGATWIALTFDGTPREGATQLPEASR